MNNHNSLIQFERSGPNQDIALFTLNRANKANAYNDAMVADFRQLLITAINDPTIKAAIIRGAGGKVFCAGADKDSLKGRDHIDGLNLQSRQLFNAIAAAPWPTIAAIEGPAIAGGLELAMACDYRLCQPNSWFALPEIELNLIPAAGGIWRLSKLIGEARAKAMVLFGHKTHANDALQWGLVSQLSENPTGDALTLAAQVAAGDPLATRLAKLAFAGQQSNNDSVEAIAQALLYQRKNQSGGAEKS